MPLSWSINTPVDPSIDNASIELYTAPLVSKVAITIKEAVFVPSDGSIPYHRLKSPQARSVWGNFENDDLFDFDYFDSVGSQFPVEQTFRYTWKDLLGLIELDSYGDQATYPTQFKVTSIDFISTDPGAGYGQYNIDALYLRDLYRIIDEFPTFPFTPTSIVSGSGGGILTVLESPPFLSDYFYPEPSHIVIGQSITSDGNNSGGVSITPSTPNSARVLIIHDQPPTHPRAVINPYGPEFGFVTPAFPEFLTRPVYMPDVYGPADENGSRLLAAPWIVDNTFSRLDLIPFFFMRPGIPFSPLITPYAAIEPDAQGFYHTMYGFPPNITVAITGNRSFDTPTPIPSATIEIRLEESGLNAGEGNVYTWSIPVPIVNTELVPAVFVPIPPHVIPEHNIVTYMLQPTVIDLTGYVPLDTSYRFRITAQCPIVQPPYDFFRFGFGSDLVLGGTGTPDPYDGLHRDYFSLGFTWYKIPCFVNPYSIDGNKNGEDIFIPGWMFDVEEDGAQP